jgi:trehalose-6-phosphate synthase
MTGTHTITDAAHKAKFTLRLVSTTNTFGLSTNYVNRKYQITVSQINSDYTDTGYTIPIFLTNSDLTANITETV